jgi:hypothetical protein
MPELVADEMRRTRLDFSEDKTRLDELFGREPLTITQMQNRLWAHIEDNHIVVNGKGNPATRNGKG